MDFILGDKCLNSFGHIEKNEFRVSSGQFGVKISSIYHLSLNFKRKHYEKDQFKKRNAFPI